MDDDGHDAHDDDDDDDDDDEEEEEEEYDNLDGDDDDDDDDNDDDDDDEDDDDDDDDDDERKMMMWMLRRKTDPKTRKQPGSTLCASLRSRNAHGHLTRAILCETITGKMPYADSGDIVFCEHAQSKCSWTFENSHFVWKFTGKMPDAYENTSIKHRALTLTIRTPQGGHTVWGNRSIYIYISMYNKVYIYIHIYIYMIQKK